MLLLILQQWSVEVRESPKQYRTIEVDVKLGNSYRFATI